MDSERYNRRMSKRKLVEMTEKTDAEGKGLRSLHAEVNGAYDKNIL